MSIVNSRESLKLWALRRLGHPTIKINVDDDQLEERIDEALQFFQDYHFDGVERVLIKHVVTEADKTNGYITVDDGILAITRIMPYDNAAISRGGIFSAKYQFHLNNVFDTTKTSLIYYKQVMDYVSLLDFLFTSSPQIEFNRHKSQVTVTYDWSLLNVGEYLILEGYAIVDPNDYPKIYNDRFLKQYVYALFKLQWANNLKKYSGIQLIGGVQFNGSEMYQEAVAELNNIEEKVQDMYSPPPEFSVG